MVGPACRSQSVAESISVLDAPVFYPTEQEFERPLEYIASIRQLAEPCGLCKVVPPPSWNPPFALNRARFSFKTRVQRVNELQQRSDPAQRAQEFYSQYRAWLLRTQVKSFPKNPSYAVKDVDLSILFRLVLRKGGHAQVTKDKGWREICQAMKVGALCLCMWLMLPGKGRLVQKQKHTSFIELLKSVFAGCKRDCLH